MKKHIWILCTSLLCVSLFAGCRSRKMPMETTVPTRPLATIEPTTVPTRPEGRPTAPTRESNPARDTAPTREVTPTTETAETVRPTIEDGNGPIPSQKSGR